MFWKYNVPSSTQIDTLLEKENVTLLELMEAEELLQECRAQNKKLVEFLTQSEILEELVSLVAYDPPPDRELAVRFKYANLATELLTCDVPTIVDKLASSSNLLEILYKFLEREKPLNPLLASFVSKVLGMLVKRRQEQVLEFLKSKKDFVDITVRHIGTSAVMDLLCKLISGVDDEGDLEIKRDIHQWLNEYGLVEQLIDKLTPDCDSEEHSSVDQLISEIINSVHEPVTNSAESQGNNGQSMLLVTLESKQVVNKLMDMLLSEGRNESTVSHVINILLTLLSPKKPCNNHPSDSLNSSVGSLVKFRLGVLETVLERLHELHDILLQPTKLGTLTTAFGMDMERLGATRLQVVSLLAALIELNDIKVHTDMANLNTLKILLDLFFNFSLNNFLHTQVTRCITCIIEQPLTSVDVVGESDCEKAKDHADTIVEIESVEVASEGIDGLNNNPIKKQYSKEEYNGVEEVNGDEKSETGPTDEEDWTDPPKHPLLDQLFGECNIIGKILECYSKSETIAENKSHNLIGYMGHMREISNAIVNSMAEGQNSKHIRRLIKMLPRELKCEWEDFSQVTLSAENVKNLIIPISIPDDDSDCDFMSAEQFFFDSNMVIMNQGFKEGDSHTASDFVNDFKDNDDQRVSLSDQLNSRCIDEVLTGGQTEDDGKPNMDELIEQLFMSKASSNFDDMWKDKEKEITFRSTDKSGVEEIEEHSSSEEEGDIDEDEEFDTLRSNEEKMDVDFAPEDWSEVFDRRGSGETEFNPWQAAQHSDTKGSNSWADFNSFDNVSSNPFPEDEDSRRMTMFPIGSKGNDHSIDSVPAFPAAFRSIFNPPTEHNATCSPEISITSEFSGFEAHLESTVKSCEEIGDETTMQDMSAKEENLPLACDPNQSKENVQMKSSQLPQEEFPDISGLEENFCFLRKQGLLSSKIVCNPSLENVETENIENAHFPVEDKNVEMDHIVETDSIENYPFPVESENVENYHSHGETRNIENDHSPVVAENVVINHSNIETEDIEKNNSHFEYEGLCMDEPAKENQIIELNSTSELENVRSHKEYESHTAEFCEGEVVEQNQGRNCSSHSPICTPENCIQNSYIVSEEAEQLQNQSECREVMLADGIIPSTSDESELGISMDGKVAFIIEEKVT